MRSLDGFFPVLTGRAETGREQRNPLDATASRNAFLLLKFTEAYIVSLSELHVNIRAENQPSDKQSGNKPDGNPQFHLHDVPLRDGGFPPSFAKVLLLQHCSGTRLQHGKTHPNH